MPYNQEFIDTLGPGKRYLYTRLHKKVTLKEHELADYTPYVEMFPFESIVVRAKMFEDRCADNPEEINLRMMDMAVKAAHEFLQAMQEIEDLSARVFQPPKEQE